MVEFRILGPLEARSNGNVLSLGGPKPRALVAALLVERNRVVAIDDLAEAVWSDGLPSDPRHALAVYVSTLRKSLGATAIAREGEGYLLEVADEQLDAARFESLVAQGAAAFEEGDDLRVTRTLAEALALWRGAALADFSYSAFAALEAGRLEERRLDALETRIEAGLRLGLDAQLVAEIGSLAAEHPLRERFRAQLMLALYRCGRQADALEVYRQTRRLLVDQLGLEPSAELRELEQAILRQDARLDRARRRRGMGRLPAAVTSFVDRDQELDEIRDLLARADVRLVTLTGPGGIGKTRLALAVAAAIEDRYPDGAWFVDLAPLRDADLLGDAIAHALAARFELERHIGDKRMLLVLDNLEHLLDGTPTIVRLLQACPNVEMLATSRVRLHVSGEHVYDVPPLSEADAIALFDARARAVRREFHADKTVTAICRRLDGLPLAIELAAGRLADLTAAELRDQLDSDLPSLGDGPRDAPERQRTIRSTIAWSCNLLTPAEQEVFARLSVFDGGWTAAAAEAVCATDARTLATLADTSLVRVEGERYGMLETIRDYAAAQLTESGRLEQTRRRHAEWYAHFATRAEAGLQEGAQEGWLANLRTERDNVRAALRFSDGADLPDLRLRLVLGQTTFWIFQGDYAEARRWLTSALAYSHGDLESRSWCLANAAFAACCQEDLDAAELLTAELWTCSEQAGPRTRARVAALVQRALMAHLRGDNESAIADGEEALALAEEIEYGRGSLISTSNLASYALAVGDLARAEELYGRVVAVEDGDTKGDPQVLAIARVGLGELAATVRNVQDAALHFERAGTLLSESGLRDPIVVSTVLIGLAWVAAVSGESERAHRLLDIDHRLRVGVELALQPSEERLWKDARKLAGDLATLSGVPDQPGEPVDVDEALAHALWDRTASG